MAWIESHQELLNHPKILRRWAFYADDSFYLDSEGAKIDYTEAYKNPFIGDGKSARNEANRRADSWEEKNKSWISRIIYESLGLVKIGISCGNRIRD